MDIQEIERVLTEACDTVIADGWKLKRKETVDEDRKRCCPIGAFGVLHDRHDLFNAGRLAGFPDSVYVAAFATGFDGDKRPTSMGPAFGLAAYYDLGVSFRKRYISRRRDG